MMRKLVMQKCAGPLSTWKTIFSRTPCGRERGGGSGGAGPGGQEERPHRPVHLRLHFRQLPCGADGYIVKAADLSAENGGGRRNTEKQRIQRPGAGRRNNLGSQIQQARFENQQCCCETQRLIERGFCDVINAGNQNTQRIIDKMTCNELKTLCDQLQTANFQLSQQAQSANRIATLRPPSTRPWPSRSAPPPQRPRPRPTPLVHESEVRYG